MNALDREIARQRAALARIETDGARSIAASYREVEGRLRYNLTLLTEEIERARQARVEVKPGWLFAQRRYAELLRQLRHTMFDFLQAALGATAGAQRAAIERAPKDAERLIVAALGPGTRESVVWARSTLRRLPAPALERVMGRASDGHPLGAVIGDIAPDAVAAVRDSLAFGVATGQNPKVIAADVMIQSGIARNRALTIARTEVLGAYRAVSQQRFQQSRMVQGWTWAAVLDARTCAMCAAMNGSEHPVTEPMASHPSCRCSAIPLTKSWADLGFTGIPDTRPRILNPEEAFSRLTHAQQIAILGPTRLTAYDDGEISLHDLVHHTHSPRWGTGRRTATLSEMGLRA